MDDTISRSKTLDAFAEYVGGGMSMNDFDALWEIIEKMPPAREWIPVSERLPEIHQDVLLSLRSLDVDTGFRAETEPYFYVHGYYIEPQDVLAWMPLPEPWTGEKENG